MLEQSTVKDDLINQAREKMINKDEKIKESIKALISIYDSFDDMYSFAIKSDNEALREAINFQKEKNVKLLLTSGIAVIGAIDESFDSKMHIAKEVKFDEALKVDHIIEVLKDGKVFVIPNGKG